MTYRSWSRATVGYTIIVAVSTQGWRNGGSTQFGVTVKEEGMLKQMKLFSGNF